MIGVYLKISRYIEKEKDKDKNHHKNNKYVLKIPPTHPTTQPPPNLRKRYLTWREK